MDFGKYLGDAVYGALDGIVTTFAIVAGVVGASLGTNVILILGIANLLADGISMAAGNYLSKRSEQEYRKREREHQAHAIEEHPERGKEELRKMYQRRGFRGKQLKSIVATVTKDHEEWARELADEHGNSEPDISPVVAGTTTFVAFVIIGAVPLLSYAMSMRWTVFQQHAFAWACALTAGTIFIVGSARALVIAQKWYRAGFEMLFVGGLAAFCAYAIGFVLKGMF